MRLLHPRGFAPRTPLHALSRAASPARSVRVAHSLRSFAMTASTLVLCSALWAQTPATKQAPPTTQAPALTHVDEIRRYIKRTWTTLTRSPRDLARAAPDPKMHKPDEATWAVYIAADESR